MDLPYYLRCFDTHYTMGHICLTHTNDNHTPAPAQTFMTYVTVWKPRCGCAGNPSGTNMFEIGRKGSNGQNCVKVVARAYAKQENPARGASKVDTRNTWSGTTGEQRGGGDEITTSNERFAIHGGPKFFIEKQASVDGHIHTTAMRRRRKERRGGQATSANFHLLSMPAARSCMTSCLPLFVGKATQSRKPFLMSSALFIENARTSEQEAIGGASAADSICTPGYVYEVANRQEQGRDGLV